MQAAVTIRFENVWGLILTIVFIVAMAVVSSRLLGVRTSRWRSIVASVIGWVIGLAGAVPVARHRSLEEYYAVAVLFAVLATMALRIVMEFLAGPERRPRRRRRPPLLHPARWFGAKLAPFGRFRQIAGYARKRGLARLEFASAEGVANREFGRRLRLTLEDAGGMFVKFGQIASTRDDLLGEAVTEELSRLRSSVRPIPPEELRPLVEAELSQRVEEVFASFDWEPMASASIGQTHRAELPGGERVIVKIQRPGMQTLLARDATVLRLLAALAERRVEGARGIGLRGLAEELVIGMERELDYRREAAMSKRLSRELEADVAVAVPAVHEDISTDRLLVMEEAVASPVDDSVAIADSGVPPYELARSLLGSFLTQVLRGGAYHADPHPGNVLIDGAGRLWLIDFGAVGLLDPVTRESLQEIALGVSVGEPLLVSRAVRRLTNADADTDLRTMETDIGLLMVESASGGGFDPRIIQDVLAMITNYGLQVPRSMTQLSRAMLTLEGTLRVIAPSFDLSSEATEVVSSSGAAADGPAEDMLNRELLRALPVLRALPQQADELATQLRSGRLTLRVERYSGGDRAALEQWVDRVLVAAVGMAGAVAAALLLVASAEVGATGVSGVLRAIGFIGLVFAAVLLMRTVSQALQRERSHALQRERSSR